MKLEVTQLSKEFVSLRGRVRAVEGIDLTVEEGEFFVLLGPSGCGKSTLLNLIAGLEKPTRGDIRFGGRLVASVRQRIFLPPRERRVAMVFQSYALYPHLDVFANIAFPLKIARLPATKVREAVQRVAATLKIDDLLSARPGELSGGQRQRVAIARAVVREPQVLLLDEPLSNLDMQLRTSTRAELKRLQRELGITTLYVTHDQTEAVTLGDRIAVLDRGQVEQIGTSEDLYLRPASPFVARFVGMPPMNLIRGTVEEEDGTVYLHFAGRRLMIPASDRELLASLPSGEALIGIRPEHIRIDGGERDQLFRGIVETVEPLGREVLLHVRIGGETLQVLTQSGKFRRKERLKLSPDPEKIYFFPL